MASGSDRNTDARDKQGTERTEKIFSSITTDKGQLNTPGRCPNVPCQIVLGIWASGIWWDLGGSGGTGSCVKLVG